MKLNKLETKEDLGELFKNLNEDLFRYIYVRCGYNKELAQDMTQEIFIKAWTKREQFDSRKSSLKNWIYIIARNYIIDYYKKKNFEKNISEEHWEIICNEVSTNSSKGEMMEEIIEAMDKLNEDDKELLTLRYIQELEINEICNIIGANYIATKVRIHRALNRLKKLIKNE